MTAPEESIEDENRRMRARLSELEAQNDKAGGFMPETDVELRKDIYTPERSGGDFSQYITKHAGLGWFTEPQQQIILMYQSIIANMHAMGLNREPWNFAGMMESEKNMFMLSSSAIGGKLLQNLSTQRMISDMGMGQSEQMQGKRSLKDKIMPQGQEAQQGGY